MTGQTIRRQVAGFLIFIYGIPTITCITLDWLEGWPRMINDPTGAAVVLGWGLLAMTGGGWLYKRA